MKALTVKPIWAGLIETGLKTIEVRSRTTHYRGPLVICTSRRAAAALDDPTVPKGVTLCPVDLADSRPMTPEDEAAAGVAWRPGAWAWVLCGARSVGRLPVRGRLGFFHVPAPQALSAKRGRKFPTQDGQNVSETLLDVAV